MISFCLADSIGPPAREIKLANEGQKIGSMRTDIEASLLCVTDFDLRNDAED